MKKSVKYQKYRTIGKELSAKIMNSKYVHFDINSTLKALNLIIDNKVVFDADAETDAIMSYTMDFILKNGKNCWEQYWDSDAELTEEEEIILDARIDSKYALLEILKTDSKNKTVLLKNLYSNEEIEIIDFGVSLSGINGGLLYAGIVKFDDFNMTSGGIAAFDVGSLNRILNERSNYYFKKRKKPTPKEDFKFYFHLNRRIGTLKELI